MFFINIEDLWTQSTSIKLIWNLNSTCTCSDLACAKVGWQKRNFTTPYSKETWGHNLMQLEFVFSKCFPICIIHVPQSKFGNIVFLLCSLFCTLEFFSTSFLSVSVLGNYAITKDEIFILIRIGMLCNGKWVIQNLL